LFVCLVSCWFETNETGNNSSLMNIVAIFCVPLSLNCHLLHIHISLPSSMWHVCLVGRDRSVDIAMTTKEEASSDSAPAYQ
jgi:hypothetical protein